MYPHTFALTTGDWSSDGHGVTDTTIINSSIDHNQFKNAVKAAADKFGMKYTDHEYFFHLDYCDSYDDCKFPVEFLQAMEFDIETLDGMIDPPDQEYAYIGFDDWVKIHIHMVKTILPLALIDIVTMPSLTIGGYGLFVM